MMEREMIWDKCKVKDVRFLRVENPICVKLGTKMIDVLPKFTEDLRTRHIYIVDANRRLKGVIRLNDVVRFLFPEVTTEEFIEDQGGMLSILSVARATGIFSSHDPFDCPVEEIMNDDPAYVGEEGTISEVARILLRERINELVVVDAKHRVIGQINVCEIIDTLLKHRTEVDNSVS